MFIITSMFFALILVVLLILVWCVYFPLQGLFPEETEVFLEVVFFDFKIFITNSIYVEISFWVTCAMVNDAIVYYVHPCLNCYDTIIHLLAVHRADGMDSSLLG